MYTHLLTIDPNFLRHPRRNVAVVDHCGISAIVPKASLIDKDRQGRDNKKTHSYFL